eukprot:jgi/Hompol1/6539/HPOL_005011-RA
MYGGGSQQPYGYSMGSNAHGGASASSGSDGLSFQQFSYGDTSGRGYAASSSVNPYSTGSFEQPYGTQFGAAQGIDMSNGVTWQSIRAAFSTGGLADEPPLLEELGINFMHIKTKGLTVMNPFGSVDQHIMDDTDLAGPLIFCFLFGGFLLLSGKVHFGFIYGVAMLGWLSMYAILNLMSETGIDGYKTASVLGYSLLPMVILSSISIMFELHGPIGLFLSSLSVLWCTFSSSTIFVTVLSMTDQRLLVAYPVALFYSAFALLAREVLARRIGESLGLRFSRPVGELRDHFVFAAPKDSANIDTAASHLHRRALDHSSVMWAEVQLPRKRLFKRELLEPSVPLSARHSQEERGPPLRVGDIAGVLGIKDPQFKNQWHLLNQHEPGNDINVTGVWMQDITGKGITVGFIDDGIAYTNKDLEENFSMEGSYDFNFHKKEPMPSLSDDTHGTRCAGEVAAVKNDVCGVGVAWHSKVAGIRVLSGDLTSADEAAAINYAYNTTQIYSCSWGPRDDGKTMEAPPDIVTEAVKNGIDNGRSGLGSIFVFAAGNGGSRGDNCNYDGYTNSIYTITVGAIDRQEQHPQFSEQCPANLISMWSGQGMSGIVTTDWLNGCTDRHGGTSAAAPLASGIYALVLSIRPDLSWRDIQRLTVETAYPISLDDSDWKPTAAGR